MKYAYSTAAVLVSAGGVRASVQGCTGSSILDPIGNYYCGLVNHILYSNVGHAGSYQAVTNMDDYGNCQFADAAFSGPLAPFNEGLSVHIRGPTDLKQFAVYKLGASPRKARRHDEGHVHARRHEHSHQHFHRHQMHHHHSHQQVHEQEKRKDSEPPYASEHANEQEKRNEVVWVTATIDGQVVSWINDYFGPTPEPAPVPAPAPAEPAPAPAVPTPEPAPIPPAPAEVAAPPPPAGGDGVSGPQDGKDKEKAKPPYRSQKAPQRPARRDYGRVGYYHADRRMADGITFLGNYGGQGSGRFDYKWGNSLSYLNAQGTGGAPWPQILRPGTIPSNREYSIFTDRKCNGDCGFYRPGSVAYHGFDGADKVFLFEFSMPLDGTRGFNADMPAIWFLNAKIPRTQQYGGCTCWPSCGEFDMYEVLDSGNRRCKSTVHSNMPGGASDWFERPVGKAIKVAAVFDSASGSISVKVLPDDTVFGSGLSREQVMGWLRREDSPFTSLFTFGS